MPTGVVFHKGHTAPLHGAGNDDSGLAVSCASGGECGLDLIKIVGVRLQDVPAEMIYGIIEKPEDVEKLGDAFREVPLGQGSVDFPNYLKALEDIGFRGFLTIEREAGDDPAADIKIAYDFLKKTMA